MMKMRSKRERRVGGRFMFYIIDFFMSYFESTGFAAANMAVREFS